MRNTLYLTGEEQKVFATLPSSLTKNSTVEEEKLQFQDTEEKLETRIRSMNLENATLRALHEQALQKRFTQKEVAGIAEKADLTSLSSEDLMEISFAWGPGVFDVLITMALPNLQSDEDLQAVSHLTDIRHGLLTAFNRELA